MPSGRVGSLFASPQYRLPLGAEGCRCKATWPWVRHSGQSLNSVRPAHKHCGTKKSARKDCAYWCRLGGSSAVTCYSAKKSPNTKYMRGKEYTGHNSQFHRIFLCFPYRPLQTNHVQCSYQPFWVRCQVMLNWLNLALTFLLFLWDLSLVECLFRESRFHSVSFAWFISRQFVKVFLQLSLFKFSMPSFPLCISSFH
jgi:hypothetical protein